MFGASTFHTFGGGTGRFGPGSGNLVLHNVEVRSGILEAWRECFHEKGSEVTRDVIDLADEIAKYGGQPITMDLSLGGEVDWADITLDEVLASNNTSKEDVFKSSRTEAIDMVGNAGAIKIMELYEKGEVDGIISWAGTVGTSAVTIVMRALPMGIPKMMLCSAASGDVSK